TGCSCRTSWSRRAPAALNTCPQRKCARLHRVIERELDLPVDEMVIVGMALGYADADAPENRLATTRELVTGFAKLSGFE
ncbi:MAG: nitroreductase, partial [Proteobacteria bacterium]|nr:nitroreductase [Pseudomonadota bacterium]